MTTCTSFILQKRLALQADFYLLNYLSLLKGGNMRSKKAKMLRKMAQAMANPKYTEKMYTVRTTETKEKDKEGKPVVRKVHQFMNAKDSARGIYRRLKQGG